MMVGTAAPWRMPGRKRQRRMAFIASSSRPNVRSRERAILMSPGRPSGMTTTSSQTLPWIFARIASVVYCGLTCEIRVGWETPDPGR